MDERSAFDLFQAEGFHFAGLLLFPEFEIRRQRLAYRDPPHAFLAFGRANASIGCELLLNSDASSSADFESPDVTQALRKAAALGAGLDAEGLSRLHVTERKLVQKLLRL